MTYYSQQFQNLGQKFRGLADSLREGRERREMQQRQQTIDAVFKNAMTPDIESARKFVQSNVNPKVWSMWGNKELSGLAAEKQMMKPDPQKVITGLYQNGLFDEAMKYEETIAQRQIEQQKLAAQMASKGETQGPAAQIFVDDKGKAWQLSREQGNAVAVPYEFKAAEEVPKFSKPGSELQDSEGNVWLRPHGSNTVLPILKDGKQMQDPNVKKGLVETDIKQQDLALRQKEFDMQVEKFNKNREENLVNYETFKMKNANRIDELKEFSQVAGRLADNPALKGITGAGKLAKFAPGTRWADADTDRQFLIAKSAIQSMEKLKSESPTGATGFGSMQANELKIIIDNFATLENTNQTPAKMAETLKRIQRKIDAWIDRQLAFEKKVGYIRKRFNSVQEAEAANLPKGTIIHINGRKAVVE